jgi:hypothetical protein
MGTVEGPVTVVAVETPTVYKVTNKGCDVATFTDAKHAQAYAEWICPPPKVPEPRHVKQLDASCRDAEWVRYKDGIYYWRWNTQSLVWQYSDDRKAWDDSYYSRPFDTHGYLFHEVPPSLVEVLDGAED